jgi:hypothetical protein
MTRRWRSAICAAAALVAPAAACATAAAKAPCDQAAAAAAVQKAADAINASSLKLLTHAFEPWPKRVGRPLARTPALHIARAAGNFATVTELNYRPGATTAQHLTVDLGRVSALGHWKVDYVDLGNRKLATLGIGVEFAVVRPHSTLHYYGEGGFDCQTGRIFTLAPLRQ